MGRWGFVLLALVAGTLFAGTSSTPAVDYVKVSGPMPLVEGKTLDGSRLLAQDYRGKVVVVNFWASWCAPCRREQPALQRLSSHMKDVRFIGVDYRDTDEAARHHLREFGVSYPSVTDPLGKLGSQFDIPYIPTTVIADASGQLRFRLAGPQTAGTIRALVEPLVR